MKTLQPGVFAQGTRSHFQLEFSIPKTASVESVRSALRSFREPAVTFGGANVVVGFGPDLWKRLAPKKVPKVLKPFAGVQGPKHAAPGTQRDVWIWVHGHGHDIALDVSRGAAHALMDVGKLELEVPCFVYRDSRDLFGFIDGTENPPVLEAPPITLIPDGQPGEGGSIAFTQKWKHNISKFQALPVKEQERVFGRTRQESIELADDAKPETAHIARTVIEEDGEELEIFRRSVPYGGVKDHGLYFIAFTNEPRRIDMMLDRMFGVSGDGLSDRLIDFSKALTGSYFFVPSLEDLSDAIGAG
jgi:putative iron-dependent peroxidase